MAWTVLALVAGTVCVASAFGSDPQTDVWLIIAIGAVAFHDAYRTDETKPIRHVSLIGIGELIGRGFRAGLASCLASLPGLLLGLKLRDLLANTQQVTP
ncbi:hypothetical protein [Yoonia sp. SS1-5]|uniref:Uncharacterized protein n=1 Tax=Yoonia rhodophyticola TaxID=3137370 RepID=A0AAN0NM16_9RHOB